MPTPYGTRGGMAFGAGELRVLRRALALALHPSSATVQDVQDCHRLAESLDDTARESGRFRAFLLADLARYRAALPGGARGYLAVLDEALDAAYRPVPDDFTALRALLGTPAAAALLERCRAAVAGPGRGRHNERTLLPAAREERTPAVPPAVATAPAALQASPAAAPSGPAAQAGPAVPAAAYRCAPPPSVPPASAAPLRRRLLALPGGLASEDAPESEPAPEGAPAPERTPDPEPAQEPAPDSEPARRPAPRTPGRPVPTPAEVFPPKRRPAPGGNPSSATSGHCCAGPVGLDGGRRPRRLAAG